MNTKIQKRSRPLYVGTSDSDREESCAELTDGSSSLTELLKISDLPKLAKSCLAFYLLRIELRHCMVWQKVLSHGSFRCCWVGVEGPCPIPGGVKIACTRLLSVNPNLYRYRVCMIDGSKYTIWTELPLCRSVLAMPMSWHSLASAWLAGSWSLAAQGPVLLLSWGQGWCLDLLIVSRLGRRGFPLSKEDRQLPAQRVSKIMGWSLVLRRDKGRDYTAVEPSP